MGNTNLEKTEIRTWLMIKGHGKKFFLLGYILCGVHTLMFLMS